MEIRNFCIIAHVDHGKSTLADRFLELTHTIESRKMRPQALDQMELERERGITIKMQPVRMGYAVGDTEYVLNLIDTPGHVDFSYEVSRALAAVEGAILLVDATQGIQAQTIANLHLAREAGLAIIPAINKIDVASVDRAEQVTELASLLGVGHEQILLVSGKTGEGVRELLLRVIDEVPPPQIPVSESLQALVFDSQFDVYKGVVLHIRVMRGRVARGDKIYMMRSGKTAEVLEVGYFAPELRPSANLAAGEIGYLATGLKEAGIRVGDTIIHLADRERDIAALPGYEEPKPVVFASLYPAEADDFPRLQEALAKLKLNDAALTFEVESSEALGRGFRVGFLGMLHMEIVTERIRREAGLEVVLSTPSVAYRLRRRDGGETIVYSAADLPDDTGETEIAEPWVRLEVIVPSAFLGAVLKLFESGRGEYRETKYLSPTRVLIVYRLPLTEVIVDLYDRLKSASSGYASMGYEFERFEVGDLLRLDILIAGKRERAFSTVVTRDESYHEGKRLVEKLKSLLPQQAFAVPLQASVGGRVIARETIPAMRKDVTGYLYGGDRTRKMKLWQKQKKGKKRLAELGRGSVEIPPDVFLKMLKR